ncbi:MAG: cardiolipin synthase [Rubrivivax sp.]|nr:MAG: cardiolipin synthase [Rubrivivax sp.]
MKRSIVCGLMLSAVLSLGGCGTLPSREAAASPPQAAVSTAQLASQIVVHSPRGRLNKAQRAALIQRLEAEGKPDLLARQMAVMSDADKAHLFEGNDVKLLIDGPRTFDAMFAALEKAETSIMLESYIIEDADVAKRLSDLLKRKQAAGVRTYIIYDHVGSIGTSKSFFQELSDQGVAVCAFNPISPLKRPGYWGINHRDHRKIIVIDGHTGFTGGINISKVYSSGSFLGSGNKRSPEEAATDGWRDTHVEIRGPAAYGLERMFRRTWASQGCKGEMLPRSEVRPARAGPRVMEVIASGPKETEGDIYLSLLAAIDASKQSVHLTMAYFAPGQDMVQALVDAAQRGVDVSLVLPSLSDFKPVLYAGRSYYEQLLGGGVKIFELQSAVLHAKTGVVDGVWSTVGSSNMDWRSFAMNDEVNVVVLGDDFGRDMAALFQRDVKASKQITLKDWKERPASERIKEWMSRVWERVM